MPGYCLLQGGVEEEEVKHKHLYHAHKHTWTHRYVHMQPKYGNRQAHANTIIYAKITAHTVRSGFYTRNTELLYHETQGCADNTERVKKL